MTLLATIQVALNALRQNSLRSVLAMIGIIIGVGAVIAMASVTAGAKKSLEETINSFGSTQLILRPGSSRWGGRRGAGTAAPFVDADVEALRSEIPEIGGISGLVSASGALVYGNKNWSSSVRGVDVDYLDVRNWTLAEGRNFTPREIASKAKMAIVGQTVVEQLFDGNNPVGQRIRIKNVPFTIIGVTGEKGESSWGQDQDDIVFTPITTTRARLIGSQNTVPNAVRNIYLTVADVDDMEYVQERIAEVLRVRRKVQPGAKDDFNVFNLAEFIKARRETESTMGYLLAVAALISLVVGGIGIMNIMLVSVTERTREIGLRLAVGARGGDIMVQFLVEAVVMCLIGGIFGAVFGFIAAHLLGEFGGTKVFIDPLFSLLALASSTAVGVFFGFYPARSASRLNPIDALRYE